MDTSTKNSLKKYIVTDVEKAFAELHKIVLFDKETTNSLHLIEAEYRNIRTLMIQNVIGFNDSNIKLASIRKSLLYLIDNLKSDSTKFSNLDLTITINYITEFIKEQKSYLDKQKSFINQIRFVFEKSSIPSLFISNEKIIEAHKRIKLFLARTKSVGGEFKSKIKKASIEGVEIRKIIASAKSANIDYVIINKETIKLDDAILHIQSLYSKIDSFGTEGSKEVEGYSRKLNSDNNNLIDIGQTIEVRKILNFVKVTLVESAQLARSSMLKIKKRYQ